MKNMKEVMEAIANAIEQTKEHQSADQSQVDLDTAIANYEKNGNVNKYLYDGISHENAYLFKTIAVALPEFMISDEEISVVHDTVSRIMLPADIINAASKGFQFSNISELYFWRNALIENFSLKADIALKWTVGVIIGTFEEAFNVKKEVYPPHWIRRYANFSHYCANEYVLAEEAMIADAHAIATCLVNNYSDYAKGGFFSDSALYIEMLSKATQTMFTCLKTIASFAIMYSHLGTSLGNNFPEEITNQILPGNFYDYRFPMLHRANYDPADRDYEESDLRKFYIILGREEQK